MTTTALTPFQYGADTVRSVIIDNEPWFVVSDAAKLLGYRDASNAARILRPHQQGYSEVSTPSGTQRMLVSNEGGINRLIMRSNASNAEAVQDWFTDTVLPSIRKTGSYSTAPALTGPELLAHAVIEAQAMIAAKDQQIAELAPKAEFFDELMDAEGMYSMQAAAKMLGFGPNILFRECRRAGILQGNNLPYQRYEHHFKVIPGTYKNRKTGETVPTATTKVRPSGVDFLRKKLAGVLV